MKKYKDKKTGEILILEQTRKIKNHTWYYLNNSCGLTIVASTYQIKNNYELINNKEGDESFREREKMIYEMGRAIGFREHAMLIESEKNKE